MFPDKDFISSYVARPGIKSSDSEAAIQALVTTARGNLIEKIRVEVSSVSTSQLSDINGQVSDSYKNTTTSEASLDVVGLEIKRYYDKKKKTARVFVYANKMTLAKYYADLIDQNLTKIKVFMSESDTYLASNNLKDSYKVLARSYKLLFEIEEAQAILLALGADNSSFYDRSRIPPVSNEFNTKMEALKKNPLMTVDDLGFILANAMQQSFFVEGATVNLEEITFQETGMASEFSFKLGESLAQNFTGVQEENFAYKVTGNYWNEGERLKVSTSLVRNKDGALQGSGQAWIHKSELQKNNTVIIPIDIQKVEEIPFMTLKSQNYGKPKGTAGRGFQEELKVQVQIKGQNRSGVAVKYYNNADGTVYCRSVSDASGLAKCKVKKISGKFRNQVIKAELDLEKYTTMSPDNSFYQNIMKNTDVPSINIPVIVEPSLVAIRSTELNFGKPNDVLLVESKLKSLLADKGYQYTESQDRAEMVILINASSRKGGELSGIYFSYVDATVSVYDNIEGKEVYKDSFKNFKGGGGSFEDAGSKAFYSAAEKVSEEVAKVL